MYASISTCRSPSRSHFDLLTSNIINSGLSIMKEKACKRCARRKIRCDKQIPCGNCVRLGVSQTCITNSLSLQASSFFATSSTSQLKNITSPKKQKLCKRRACDRCVGRKIFCDNKFPCSSCERLHVRCHYSGKIIRERQEIEQKQLEQGTSLGSKNVDRVKNLLPPVYVIEEIFQVIYEGDFIWHWPCIELNRISSIIHRLKKEEQELVTITETAYLFCFLAATSSLLPAAHSCRTRNKQYMSKESNSRYKKSALELLEQDNRYAFASDDSTPLLECWAYHLLWWDSMTKVEYNESIRFCEQSLISAGIIDLFGTAFKEAHRIFATQGTNSTSDKSKVPIIVLALDLLFSNSRIRFLLPGCIVGTQLESFVNIAASSLRLCTFLHPAERALYIMRAELTIWQNRTDDLMANLFDGNQFISEEIIPVALEHIQWIEWRSACISSEFSEFFGYKKDLKSQRSTSPADITFLQRNFCLRTNVLALQCGILRILLASSGCDGETFIVKAFAKGRSLLVEIVKSWAAIIRLDWLHPTLRFSAVPFVEVSLSILYQVLQKIDLNDNTGMALSHVDRSQKQEKFQCLLWIKDNFTSIYKFLTDVGISCPSSMNLTIAFNSLQLSSSSIVRLEPSSLESYLKMLSDRDYQQEQGRLIEQEDADSSYNSAEVFEI